jgi:two-component system phosphate regulon sensor histidine kinase PhoR/two-component system sensor histidine kinase VicK
MDNITKFRQQFAVRSFLAIIVPLITTVVVWVLLDYLVDIDSIWILVLSLLAGLLAAIISFILINSIATKPLEKIEEIVTYTLHSERGGHLPDLNKLPIAKELVESISKQIYQLGSSTNTQSSVETPQTNVVTDASANKQPSQLIIDAIPLPIIGMDKDQRITLTNTAFAKYIGKPISEILSKPLYDVMNLSFQTDIGLEQWLSKCSESAVTASNTWVRVRLNLGDDTLKQFDLVANFSSGSTTGTETMLAIFDRSQQYSLDDQEIAFVAMAVHELRTPMTIMRGYIEVFEDELSDKLTPELVDFMHKMQASAQQLTAFVSNILNVARIEENQLFIKLRSENWPEILSSAIEDLQLRASVHGKTIELVIAENLPPVAADRISLHEVVNNLVDNAIKYSENSDKIIVTSQLNNDGLVETSVQDFGIGIPASVIGQLFQKFHRSHKSRVQVGGTGLGLYLSKELVNAHGGNIWVRSKEGEGSIFSFTILPFDKVSNDQTSEQDGIVRGAHGWIKNHSLYRN